MTWKQIHEKALAASAEFRRSESVLLEILIQADALKVFERFGLSSTFGYCVEVLKLSEDQAFAFIRVARKSKEVPQLRQAISEGVLTVSKAKKIASVLTPANQSAWIEKAIELPARALEREVVKQIPQTLVPDRVKPLTETFSGLHCMIDRETEALLEEAKDLVSRSLKSSSDVGTTLKAALKEFVERHSDVRKARRAAAKVAVQVGPAVVEARREGKRVALPAPIQHSVHQRDGGRCTSTHPVYGRCENKRWVELHHLVPVAQGGKHAAENIVTLCTFHHKGAHGTGRIRAEHLGSIRHRGVVT